MLMRKRKKNQPLDPKLPGPWGRMTKAELDRESDRFDADFTGTRAKRIANVRPHPKKPADIRKLRGRGMIDPSYNYRAAR